MFLSRPRPVCKADRLTAICETTVSTMWDPHHLTTLYASTASYGIVFLLNELLRITGYLYLDFARRQEF
jgi:hypothetical protein